MSRFMRGYVLGVVVAAVVTNLTWLAMKLSGMTC